MRSLGCLVVILLVVAGALVWLATRDMTDARRAQWVGEKAHRGWNAAREFTEHAKEGWNKTDDVKPSGTAKPEKE